jgi:hypothetical protein
MTKVVWLILLLAVVVTVLAAVFKGGGRRGAIGDIRPKKLRPLHNFPDAERG